MYLETETPMLKNVRLKEEKYSGSAALLLMTVKQTKPPKLFSVANLSLCNKFYLAGYLSKILFFGVC